MSFRAIALLFPVLVFCALTVPLASASGTAPAAQSAAEQNFASRMVDLNRMPPMRNPRLFKASDFLNRRVADKTNRVIGMTSDLLTSKDGGVKTVVATLDHVGIGAQTLYFDTKTVGISAGADSWTLPFHRDDIRRNLPDLLAGISAAAGHEVEIFSVAKMQGAAFAGADGKRIGTIVSPLFGVGGRQIAAFAVRGVPGAGEKVIAVPYDRTMSMESDFGTVRIVAPAELAAAVLDYARTLK